MLKWIWCGSEGSYDVSRNSGDTIVNLELRAERP